MFKILKEKKFKKNTPEDKKQLIALYEQQVQGEHSSFMKLVLIRALHILKNSDSKPSKVEDWVVDIEKMWRKIKFK
jgi:hypothetical protein